MCKQITNIHSIRSDTVRHLGFPVFRASAQGGDRYPKHGTGQSDRVLPENPRRPDGTGKTGIRCPRSVRDSAAQGPELPYKPETGAFGRGHRYRKKAQPGAGKMILPPGFFYALFLKYRSQDVRLITFLPLSHSCKLRIGMPIFLAKGFLPMPKDSRYARIRTACPS